jgi:hypothetical protein
MIASRTIEADAMQHATEENLTDLALTRWEARHSPRLRQIMQSLVKRLHGFLREAGRAPTGEVSSKPFHVADYDFVLSKWKTWEQTG